MFFNGMGKRKKNLIVATDKTAFFVDIGKAEKNISVFSQPLEHIKVNGINNDFASKTRRNRTKILLVVPDHWFKHEFFPFQSTKDALIRVFLDRKLKAAYPKSPFVSQFVSYTTRQKEIEHRGINAFYLEEENGYRLHEALCKVGLTPQLVTTPALLWAVKFRSLLPDFSKQSALVIHSQKDEAFLYFYCEGDFVFSRKVALPGGNNESLMFEINQSIYLFSQKVKKELDCIYLIDNEATCIDLLTEAFGKLIHILKLEDQEATLDREISFLQGLLTLDGISSPDNDQGVTHRRIQQQIKWRPVQWAGILIGAILLIILSAEHYWIDRVSDSKEISQLEPQTEVSLPEYETAIDELIANAKRPSSASIIAKVVSSLSEFIQLNEIKINLDASILELTATVHAENIDAFRQHLKMFAQGLNNNLKLPRPISLEDISFQIDDLKNTTGRLQHKIAFKVNLL
jgi:hypothetical protein